MRYTKPIISILWAVTLCVLAPAPFATEAQAGSLDEALEAKARQGHAPEMVSVILQTNGPATAQHESIVRAFGGNPGAHFSTIDGFVATVPTPALKGLAHNPHFSGVSSDAPMQAFWPRNTAGHPVGAFEARGTYGVGGAGIGVAVLDSGVAPHPEWRDGGASNYTVKTFVDFVDPLNKSLVDPYGHGTHVAGIIAGNGSITSQLTGIAPRSSLHVLRVLDGSGRGSVTNVLFALDWVKQNYQTYNIKVVNLSLGHAVYESYTQDPLCKAVADLVNRGIVVVCAAGNYGKTPDGMTVYGGITSPGNSPYALTVGAMNAMGTPSNRADDVIAGFSSRGPTYLDYQVKPDVVANGVFTVATESAGSYFSTNYSDLVVASSDYGAPYGEKDFFSLSGTSMAAPVVSGMVALMLQKNPSLTPNLVKGILQYTAENRGYDVMTQGAGYVNAPGALEAASKITLTPNEYQDGAYWLSAPLSGVSTIGGQATFWGGYAVTGSGVFWGSLLDFNFTNLWGLGIIWGGFGVDAFSDRYTDANVQSSAVFWDFNLTSNAVLWWGLLDFLGLSDQDIVYGEGAIWTPPGGGGKGNK
jgi:serine protease AprX